LDPSFVEKEHLFPLDHHSVVMYSVVISLFNHLRGVSTYGDQSDVFERSFFCWLRQKNIKLCQTFGHQLLQSKSAVNVHPIADSLFLIIT
jgi:hypothetical protein